MEGFLKSNTMGKEKRAVTKCDMEGTPIQEYKTTRIAAKENNISECSITNCCRGNQKSAAGFTWKYNNKYLKEKFKDIEIIYCDEDDEDYT